MKNVAGKRASHVRDSYATGQVQHNGTCGPAVQVGLKAMLPASSAGTDLLFGRH